MNPKVAKAAMLVPFDAADYTWVDLTDRDKMPTLDAIIEAGAQELNEYPVEKMPLLFEKLAVLPDSKYGEVVVTIERLTDTLRVSMWPLGDSKSAFHAQIRDDPDSPGEYLINLEIEEQVLTDLTRSLGGRAAAQERIQQNVMSIVLDVYMATITRGTAIESYACPRNPANEKRRRKNKVPLYEWKTIVIDPNEVKRVRDVVASHRRKEKCREHEVRGHWAVLKRTGKRYWVRSHKRGDPSKGTVFHDYQLKGE